MNATYEPSISTSRYSAKSNGDACTSRRTGPPTQAVTIPSARSPGSKCDKLSPSRLTTTNVFAVRNTTSATVPKGIAANPMSTSHGSSNWMDKP